VQLTLGTFGRALRLRAIESSSLPQTSKTRSLSPQGLSTVLSQLLERTSHGFRRATHREYPITIPRHGAAAQTLPNRKMKTNTMRRVSRQNAKPSGLRHAETPQNARRNYDRYLALAQAEAQNGDRIAAENYYQHAEHYLRSMHEGDARA
jgi:hypothetical protein